MVDDKCQAMSCDIKSIGRARRQSMEDGRSDGTKRPWTMARYRRVRVCVVTGERGADQVPSGGRYEGIKVSQVPKNGRFAETIDGI